jgi:hypothetical protein
VCIVRQEDDIFERSKIILYLPYPWKFSRARFGFNVGYTLPTDQFLVLLLDHKSAIKGRGLTCLKEIPM